MRRPVTIRVPDAWHGLDSDHLTRWLEDYFACPYPLPDDPGAGQARVCLSLPAKLVQKLQRKVRCPVATALRRLATAHSRELVPGSSAHAFQIVPPPASEPLERLSRPGKRKDSGVPVPWRHPDGLFYVDELAISPLEQDRIYRLTKRWAP